MSMQINEMEIVNMKAFLNCFFKLALAILLIELAVMPSQARVGGSATSGKTLYERVHSYEPGKGTFKKDPNVWVLTKEFAERTGMPTEWASSELQGAEAVAFRYEQDGAEEECGWMGDPGRCAPVFQCVLEIYFDNGKHKLPWDTVRPSMYDRSHSSIRHLGAMPWPLPSDPNLRKEEQLRRRKLYSPFTDPESGRQLVIPGFHVSAYDRDLYAGLSMLKLRMHLCEMPDKAFSFGIQLYDEKNEKLLKNFHLIHLPVEYAQRVRHVSNRDRDRWREKTREAGQQIMDEKRK
jgi:hypothetical protein